MVEQRATREVPKRLNGDRSGCRRAGAAGRGQSPQEGRALHRVVTIPHAEALWPLES
jgi:hypothetical protein